MSEEIKEKIKAYYIANDIDKILNYIISLQQKVEQLEKEKNTLMYSLTLVRQKWNNDKARYRRKAKVYRQQRNQLENIRKEAIELINKNSQYPTYYLTGIIVKNLLNILNKGSE